MNENAKAWVEALRSGAYEQCRGRLRRQYLEDYDNDEREQGEGYCCLGVACDLYQQAHPDVSEWIEDEFAIFSGPHEGAGSTTMEGALHEAVAEWLGLKDIDGQFHEKQYVPNSKSAGSSLIALNDVGATFEQIADMIERKPRGLFKE